MDIALISLLLSIASLGLGFYIISILNRILVSQNQLDTQSISQEVLIGLLNQVNSLQDRQSNQLNNNHNKLIEVFHSKSQESQIQIQSKLDQSLNSLLNSTQQELEKINLITKNQLEIINHDVQKRLDENFARNIQSFDKVSQNLGELGQKAQSMIDSTKSIDRLNAIFSRTSSKSFGSFAEDYLESMLRDHLTLSSWDKQVSIPGTADKIDFVITLGDQRIGIDSKFPLTKYEDILSSPDSDNHKKLLRTAILNMAKDMSLKYYKHNFLAKIMLYIPSDSIYLISLEDQEFHRKLNSYKISLVSPNTLYPQLVFIKSYQFNITVSNNAQKIIDGLKEISRNIKGFRDEYTKLGDKLRLASQNYEASTRSLGQIENSILLLEDR